MAESSERRRESGFHQGSAPHMAGRESTRGYMLDVLVALAPSLLLSGLYLFGYRAFLVAGVSVAGCLAFECLYCLLTKKPQTIGDGSAVITGILLAFCLPVTVPLGAVLVGDFFAIIVVKSLFGGLGKNFMNPALAGRVFLFSFPIAVTAFSAVRDWSGWQAGVDAVSAATPLEALRVGTLPDFSLLELFTGVRGGSLGEASAALLLLGGVYLVLRGVIQPRIPLAFLGTVAVLTYLFPPAGLAAADWMLYQLLSGGLVLGAVFMAPDPVTSPVTGTGQVLYGIGCGVLTVFLRYYGAYPEGVAFAILIMNACAWGLDRLIPRRGFGQTWRERWGR
ncbi:Electron transport complex, RnfABCDGE type, D subunit (fragment) [uncultured Eubacteriales bacterium]|uniref:Ion-translocating oxidoreductase complex subunit D n=1 Tax=uncultured Eubacteriales bacterium TaxID=172733 RepID=A0A212J327_9FIRM